MAELNEEYKRRHKPVRQTKPNMPHQGYYVPQRHPEKCLTKTNQFRSSWELAFFDWCDRNQNVLRWASEPLYIEYRNPLSSMKYCEANGLDWTNPIYWKINKYYPDVWVEMRDPDGTIHKRFIEIKPREQAVAPVQPGPNAKLKEVKKFNQLGLQYLQNQHKWAAATKYCAERGAEFLVYTEVELKRLGVIY